MSEISERIVIEAQSWINTPWEHQGKIKGVGVDCANFIRETLVASIPSYSVKVDSAVNNYHRREDGNLLRTILSDELEFVETSDRQGGDILALMDEALREPDIPRHLVIVERVIPTTTFVINPSERGVKRHRLNAHWIARIHSVWRVRE